MDFDQNRYYRVSRILLTCLGLWPYYPKRARYIHCVFLSPLLYSPLVFQLAALVTQKYSMDLLLNVFPYACSTMYSILRYLGILLQIDKLKVLMELVRRDWNALRNREELKIMHGYANVARCVAVIMTVCSYAILFLVTLVFLSPGVFNAVMPALNESRRKTHFPVAMEYFIDQEEHMYFLTFYSFLTGLVSLSIVISLETLSFLHIQHICAMFQIACRRIEHVVKKYETESLDLSRRSSGFYESLVEAVDGHRKAIEFVDNLRTTFGTVYLFAIPLGVMSLSIGLYHLCDCVRMRDIAATGFWFLYVGVHFVYIFLGNYVSQRVIDYSDSVFRKICGTRWYATPVQVQRYLLLIMCRSMKSSTLMIGNVFLPSLQGYATLMSSALSYFMMIYSTHGHSAYQTRMNSWDATDTQ